MKNNSLLILFGILLFLSGCESDTISPEQADTFVKFFGSSFEDIGYDVKQTSDDGYIVTGSTTISEVVNDKEVALNTDLFLMKTDKYGNSEWVKKYGDSFDDFGKSIALTADGGFIIAGTVRDTTLAGEIESDILLVKTSSDGSHQWASKFGDDNNQEGNCVIEQSNGGFVVVGSTDAYRAAGGGFESNPAGKKDAYIVQTDAQGLLVRSNSWGFPGDDVANSIAEKPDGKLIIVGSRDVGINKQIWVINATSIITATEQTTFGGTGNDIAETVQVLPDGYLITGTFSNLGVLNTYLVKLPLNIFSPPTFEKFYGGNQTSTGKSLALTPNNEIILVGSITITGSDYIYFVKTDANGDNPVYQTYGGTGDQRGESVSITSDGGFIMTGSNGFEGNTMITLVKTDSNGDL